MCVEVLGADLECTRRFLRLGREGGGEHEQAGDQQTFNHAIHRSFSSLSFRSWECVVGEGELADRCELAPIDLAAAVRADRPAAEHLVRWMPAALAAGGTGEDHRGAPRGWFSGPLKALPVPWTSSLEAGQLLV